MVKIKEGYEMSRFEQQWFDRQNALPRKTSGTVTYYYKRQTRYPPRIYVFMHAELWCDRNRRPMGLFYQHAFLTRPMNREEIEYPHFDTRLCYHQYEDWDKLLYAEEKEAAELDMENAGTGSSFLERLNSFRSRYALCGTDSENPVTHGPHAKPLESSAGSEEDIPHVGNVETPGTVAPDLSAIDLSGASGDLLGALAGHGHLYPAKVIVIALAAERGGENRKAVLIALTTLYRNFGVEMSERKPVIVEKVLHQAEVSALKTRRNFVRRVWRKNKLFALQEIRVRYPGYTEGMLAGDLTIKKSKLKRKKQKPVTDLRRCQMQKYASKLRSPLTTEKEYHDACCRVAMLQNAHDHRSPILLSVTLQKETKVYSFPWHNREDVVKRFVNEANSANASHEGLSNTVSNQSKTNLHK